MTQIPSHLREIATPAGRVVWINRNALAQGREGGRIRWYRAIDPATRRLLAEGSCRRDVLASVDRNRQR